MNFDNKEIHAKYLNAEEKVIWYGKPNPKYYMSFSEWGPFLVNTFFITVIYIYLVGLDKEQFGNYYWLILALFFIGAIYSFYDFFITRPKKLSNIDYIVSDQRILVINPNYRKKVLAYNLEDLNEITFYVRKKDMGDIDFKKYYPSTKFKFIDNVQEVYQKIIEAKEIKSSH